MKIVSYLDFISESILHTSDEFKEILSSIQDDKVAKKLLSLINQDIKTDFNILRLGVENDEVSFIPNTQAESKLKSMNLPAVMLSKSTNSTSIGRIARRILGDNSMQISDSELENFTNKFKAAYDKKFKKDESIRIVKGEEIRYWYSEKSYCKDTLDGKGTLNKSCMKDSGSQLFLDIYCENTEVIGLVIQVNNFNKLKTRALIWKTNNGIVLDRIYFTFDSDKKLIEKWVTDKFPNTRVYFYDNITSSRDESNYHFEVQLDSPIEDYKLYPYMDTFQYYNSTKRKLYNYEPSDDKKHLFRLRELDGSALSLNSRYCEFIDEYHPSENCVWSERVKSFMPKSECVISKTMDDYIPKSEAVYSNIISDWLFSVDSVVVYTDSEGKSADFYPNQTKYENLYEKDELSGEFFLTELLVKFNGLYYNKKNAIVTHQVLPESLELYQNIYNNKFNTCRKIDNTIFKIKLSNESIIETKKSYFMKHYKTVIFEKFMSLLDSINDVDKKYLDIKKSELVEADEFLRVWNKFYLNNNLIHERFGTVDNMKKLFTNIVKKSFRRSFQDLISNSRIPADNSEFMKIEDILLKYCCDPVVDGIYVSEYVPEVVYNEIWEICKNKNEANDLTYLFKKSLNWIIQDIMLNSRIQEFEHNGSNIYFYYLSNLSQFKP